MNKNNVHENTESLYSKLKSVTIHFMKWLRERIDEWIEDMPEVINNGKIVFASFKLQY